LDIRKKDEEMMNLKRVIGFVVAIGFGWAAHYSYARFAHLKFLSKPFSLKTTSSEILSDSIDGQQVYAIRSLKLPIMVNWLVTDRVAGVFGPHWEISAYVNEDGSLKGYTFLKGQTTWYHFRADGEADMRASKSDHGEVREVRIDGIWKPAHTNIVTIDGKNYRLEWTNGWKVTDQ
jgi:hypothetical protein